MMMRTEHMKPIVLLLLLISLPAWANNNDRSAPTQGQGQIQGQQQQVVVNVPAGPETNGTAGLTSTPTLTSNPALTSGDTSLDAGDTNTAINTENNSQFFAFGTTFPNSQGCFAGAQGGGSGSGGAGFLGFHYLDHNCWTSQLATQTRNVEVKARLNCSGGKFRNAIAFDQPKGQAKRQRYCVDYMVGTYNAEIEDMKRYVDDAVAAGALQLREDLVTERDQVCDERIARCEAAVKK